MSELIAPGQYRARAVECGLGKSNTGKEQLAVSYQLLDPGPFQNWHITKYSFFTEKTYERTFEEMRHNGWESDDVSDLSGIGSKEVTLVIEHETYEGEKRARVKWVNKGGGGIVMAQPMNGGERVAFAERMRALAIATKPAGGSSSPRQAPKPRTPAPVPNGGAPDVQSDDIPF